MIGRRALIGTSGLGVIAAGVMHNRSPAAATPIRTVNVRDFGAIGDGQTDDTVAFNRACRAGEPWSESLCYAVHVPSGRYRIDGTVHVRKGQTLFGDGHATYIDARKANGSTFILGRGAGGARGTPDPGGAPVMIRDFHAMGGAADHGFIETDAQGFTIAGLFLTAVGIGIEIVGGKEAVASDGLVRDIVIDQCLQGLLIAKAQNINIASIEIYRPRFAITIGDATHDVLISAAIIVYAEQVAITFSGGIVANILLSHISLVTNVQHPGFLANVLLRARQGDIHFSGCTFRNWPGTSVVQDQEGAVDVTFSGCVFNASPTTSLYETSRASGVLSITAGRFSFDGCSFRHITGAIARLSAGRARLRISGGDMADGGPRPLEIDDAFGGTVTVRDVEGFAPAIRGSGQVSTVLPLWKGAGPWRIGVRLSGSDTYAEEAVVHRRGDAVVRASGWRTDEDHPALRFAVTRSSSGSTLTASIATHHPEDAVFSAETS